MRITHLALGFALGLSIAAFSGCPAQTCSPSSCATGCCDAAGRCQTAQSTSACGTVGRLCVSCSIGESCVSGTCTPATPTPGAGGGSSGTGGGLANGGYTAFLDDLLREYCAKQLECVGEPASGIEACVTIYRAQFVVGPTGFGAFPRERSIRLGAATFDAARGAACIAQLRGFTCVGTRQVGDTSACTGVTRPAAGPNAPCDTSADCTDATTSCNGPACQQRCTPGGALGESCRKTIPECDGALVCINGSCQAEPPPGTPCQSFSGGAGCGPNGECNNGVCERLPSAGQPCPSFSCVATAYCDSTRTCRARKALGESCASSSECGGDAFCRSVCTARGPPGATCRTDSECVAMTTCFLGSCRTRGAAGASCIDSSDCASTLSCDEELRVCREPATTAQTGQPCSSTQRCQNATDVCRGNVVNSDGGIGTAGTCATPMVGDACRSSSQCGFGRYCDGTTCLAAGASTPCRSDLECRDTDYCPLSTSRCTPRVPSGQPCSSLATCLVPTERCLPTTSDGGMQRCLPRPTLGQPCFGTCAFPLACLGGTCVATGRQGQPCFPITGSNCFDGVCRSPDGGTGFSPEARCVAPQPLGSACTGNQECQSGSCEGRRCVVACN